MFAIAALDLKNETFIDHKASFLIFYMTKVLCFYKAQIVSWIINEALRIILLQYFNFIDIFSPKLVADLLEHIEINGQGINLVDSK